MFAKIEESEAITVQEQIHTHDGVDVTYKFRRGTEDRKHLTVIFSGFRAPGTYDFDGSVINGLRSNVLWILDSFHGEFSYYLCRDMDFSIEEAVSSLIESTRRDLGLERAHCSVAGFSKGGTAALYYGIKYGYGAVLSTVPQFHIGSYVAKQWPKVFSAMSGEDPAHDRSHLDDLLPQLLRDDSILGRNIYLFSSTADPQFQTEVSPYLNELAKYSNFNFVLTDSPLVTTHNAVTRYNIPLILSLLASFAEGVFPRLGEVRNGVNSFQSEEVQPTLESTRKRAELAQGLTSVEVRDNRLFLEGYSFIVGYEAGRYGAVRSFLKLQNSDREYTFLLGGVADPFLSTKFFDNVFCDYSVGKFSTLAHRGIDLETIAEGIYDVKVVTSHAGFTREFTPRPDNPVSRWGETSDSIVHLEATETLVRLVKRRSFEPAPARAYFNLQEVWSRDSLIHLEGYFAVAGFQARAYGEVVYYLAVTKAGQAHPHRIVRLASAHKDDVGARLGDPWLDYSKAYFATRSFSGVSLAGLETGTYDLAITARFGGTAFTQETGWQVAVQVAYPENREFHLLPSIGVIGSCVSRDNFNSQLAPNWKDWFTFQGAQYQMSLVSLMSPPVAAPSFEDLDLHSKQHTVRDFEKTYLKELRSEAPDVLVVDLFSDARFGCLALDAGLVTNNEWKLHESNFYRSIDSPEAISMVVDEAQYLRRFQKAVEELRGFCMEYMPKTLVVLNSARAVDVYVKEGQRASFGQKANNELNARWEKLDAVFTEIMECPRIRVNMQGMMSDENHPWGPGPVHYEDAFYREFQSQLLGIMNARTVLAVGPASQID